MSLKDRVSGWFFRGSVASAPAEGDLWVWDATNKVWRIQTLPHIADTSAAHAASAIAFTPAGTIAAVTVQLAVEEASGDLTTHAAAADPHAGYQLELAGGAWLEASVNLTNAQMLALFSSPVTIVAAGGANTIIQVLSASIALDNAAGVYVGGDSLFLMLGTDSVLTLTTAFFLTTNASSGKVNWAGGPTFAGGVLATAGTNAALKITHGTADFTGGNAANKATVKVVYRIITTLPA